MQSVQVDAVGRGHLVNIVVNMLQRVEDTVVNWIQSVVNRAGCVDPVVNELVLTGESLPVLPSVVNRMPRVVKISAPECSKQCSKQDATCSKNSSKRGWW